MIFLIFPLPKLNEDQVNSLNSPITPKQTGEVIKSFPTKKRPGLVGFNIEFYQTFKEEVIPTLLKLFHNIET